MDTFRSHLAWLLLALFGVAAAAAQTSTCPKRQDQVLFVCEHGNVKSLMAANYFNHLAQQRGLPVRAIARGAAPDSMTVPDAITDGLRKDGFDVSGFHPTKVQAEDIEASGRVVLIGVALPMLKPAPGAQVESWLDVPPATTEFAASRQDLHQRVTALLDDLMRPPPPPTPTEALRLGHQAMQGFVALVQDTDELLVSRGDTIYSDMVLMGPGQWVKSDKPIERYQRIKDQQSIQRLLSVLSSVGARHMGVCGCSPAITIDFQKKGKTLGSLGIIEARILSPSTSVDIELPDPRPLQAWLGEQKIPFTTQH